MNRRHQPAGPLALPLAVERCPSVPPEEVLVADARAHLTPADLVERKLLGLLNGWSVGGRPRQLAVPGDRGRGRG